LERYRSLFIFVFTALVMGVLGLWLAWIRDTERWGYFAAYTFVLGFFIGKWLDHRD